MEPVRSTRNARVVAASRLSRARDRRLSGLTLIEGPNVLAEAVLAGITVVEVFALPDDSEAADLAHSAGAELVAVEQLVLERLAPTKSPRGPVAVIRIPDPEIVAGDSVVLGGADPGNAGTIIRTAAAFGFDVVERPGTVDVWSPKVLRAGAGAHFRTRFCSDRAEATIAMVTHGGVPCARMGSVLDAANSWSVLVGSEAHGLAEAEIQHATVKVSIPMPGNIESLNAAIAAAIVMYELAGWRANVGKPDG